MQPVSGWQGIRDSDTSGQYLITGTSDANGLLYEGPISGAGGTSYSVNYPDAASTSVYGPDDLGNGDIATGRELQERRRHRQRFRLPGNDRRSLEQQRLPDDRLSQRDSTPTSTARWATLRSATPTVRRGTRPSARATRSSTTSPQNTFLTDIVYPGSTTTTAYGIWYNGGTSYTICGGYTNLLGAGKSIAEGYLVDYDSATGQFTNWTSFADPEWAGRTGTRHPFPGHQQHRGGRLHARCRLDPGRIEHGPCRLRG